MSFATQEDVLSTLEEVLGPVFQNFGKYDRVSPWPWRHIAFNDAMERYGSDKPDLRIDLEVQDITAEVAGCAFGPFQNATVKAVVVDNFAEGRKWIDKLLAINADQYDLVINGYESASGAVRNHDPEIMVKAFQMVGLGEEDVKAKFPAMYNAFTYGAPPHAGAAPGVDRLVMLLTGEESIREVITFPMNKNAQDLMMDAPTTVSQKQLDDVHILINESHLK